MTSRVNRAAVFVGPGHALRLDEAPLVPMRPDQLRVRVSVAGVCGSDAHRLRGDLPPPASPLTFGHEAVGVVEEVGADVHRDVAGTPVRVGDAVLWSSLTSCLRCEACVVRQEPVHCVDFRWPVPWGEASQAGFQELATLSNRTAFARIPDGASHDAVIAFGCAMPTALGGLRRLGGIAVGSTVLIQGCGPVGLASTVLAAMSLAARIIVIGGPSGRLDDATRLGATHTVDLSCSVEERRETVMALTAGRGADIVVEAAGHPSAFDEAWGLLAPGGRYLVMGLYSGAVQASVDPVLVNNRNLHVIGSLGYWPVDVHHAAGLAARIGLERGFADLIGARFALTDTEKAIDLAASGAVTKCVVEPNGPVGDG